MSRQQSNPLAPPADGQISDNHDFSLTRNNSSPRSPPGFLARLMRCCITPPVEGQRAVNQFQTVGVSMNNSSTQSPPSILARLMRCCITPQLEGQRAVNQFQTVSVNNSSTRNNNSGAQHVSVPRNNSSPQSPPSCMARLMGPPLAAFGRCINPQVEVPRAGGNHVGSNSSTQNIISSTHGATDPLAHQTSDNQTDTVTSNISSPRNNNSGVHGVTTPLAHQASDNQTDTVMSNISSPRNNNSGVHGVTTPLAHQASDNQIDTMTSNNSSPRNNNSGSHGATTPSTHQASDNQTNNESSNNNSTKNNNNNSSAAADRLAMERLEVLMKERDELGKLATLVLGFCGIGAYANPPGGLDSSGHIRFAHTCGHKIYLGLTIAGFLLSFIILLLLLAASLLKAEDRAKKLRSRLTIGWFLLWGSVMCFYGAFTAGYWTVFPPNEIGKPQHSELPKWGVLAAFIVKLLGSFIYVVSHFFG